MTTSAPEAAAPRPVPAADPGPAPGGGTRGRADRIAGWSFSAPFLALFALFLVGPAVVGLVRSFFTAPSVSTDLGRWVGLGNYAEVLTSGEFWWSMWHSTFFALLTTPPLVLLPLLAAVLVSRIRHGQWFFRLAFFGPYVVPCSAVCLIFGFMYTPGTGLLVQVLSWFGIPDPDFLGSTSGGWLAVVLVTVWWTFGFNFVLLLAAVQDVPPEVMEAAALDGAGPWQQITRITVPLLRPTLSLVLILQLLASLKVFDQIYLLLAGGPNGTTRPVIEFIYDSGFTSYRGGYASAATMVYFALLVAVSACWALAGRLRRTRAGE